MYTMDFMSEINNLILSYLITLCFAMFNSLKKKYIKPYYYRRPSRAYA